MRVGSLFAGIGGFDLAARWMGWTTSWFSEIEPYAAAVLRRHWPGVPNLGDITKITNPPPVDVLVGGFPCQDISLIGKGAGIEGERSGLWKHYARIVEEIRPRWVVAENVAALRSRGLGVVLRDLAALGYDAEWHCIPAAAAGAPHRRDRIWIVAYPNGATREGRTGANAAVEGRRAGAAEPADVQREGTARTDHAGSSGALLAYRIGARLEGHARYGGAAGREAAGGPTTASSLCSGADAAAWWASEPNVGRVAHGIPSRVDRLRCLGNAIVPQVAYAIFGAIAEVESQR